jgi:hypothetical protein
VSWGGGTNTLRFMLIRQSITTQSLKLQAQYDERQRQQ